MRITEQGICKLLAEMHRNLQSDELFKHANKESRGIKILTDPTIQELANAVALVTDVRIRNTHVNISALLQKAGKHMDCISEPKGLNLILI